MKVVCNDRNFKINFYFLKKNVGVNSVKQDIPEFYVKVAANSLKKCFTNGGKNVWNVKIKQMY